MGEIDFFMANVSALLLAAAWPIWLAGLVAGGGVYIVLPVSKALRALLALLVMTAVLILYAGVGQPGFGGWAFNSRPDLRADISSPPLLAQVERRLSRDPNDAQAWAVRAEFLAQTWNGDPQQLITISESFETADALGGLSADHYALWASFLYGLSQQVGQQVPERFYQLIDKALVIDPGHIRARLLRTEPMPRADALPLLRAIARDTSALDDLAEVVDDRILMAIVGEQPSIAPNLADIDQQRIDDVLADVDEVNGGETEAPRQPPFMRMISQLEGKVTDSDGVFLQPIGDAEFDQSLALDLYRLARVWGQIGQSDKATAAMEASLAIVEPSDRLGFWAAPMLWQLGKQQRAEEVLARFARALPESSPEWRAAQRTLEALRQAL